MAISWQRTAITAIAALLVLAGCAKSSEPPPEPPPSAVAEKPAPAPAADPFEARTGCAERSGNPPEGGVGSAVVAGGLCRTYIHTDPTSVMFHLPPEVPEAVARKSLQVEGAEPESVSYYKSPAMGFLAVTLPAGAAGDQVTVRLRGPVGPGGTEADLGFQMKRLPTPRITTEVRYGGEEWKPLQPGSTLPRAPLHLRFHLIGQPKKERVEHAVSDAFRVQGAEWRFSLSWEGDHRLVASVEEPPPQLTFRFDWLEAAHGLQVQRSTTSFHTGAHPPQLVRLDPATGEERPVGEVPADLLEGALSPDGRWAALFATAPDATDREQVWLVDTRTGARRLTGFSSSWVHQRAVWLPDRVLFPTFRGVDLWDLRTHQGSRIESEASLWGPLSPDGRYLPGAVIHHERADEQSLLAPVSIVLVDLERLAVRSFPDVTVTRLRQSDAPPSVGMVWSEGGGRLLLADVGSSGWRSLDTSSGRVEAERAAPPPEAGPRPWPSSVSGWAFRPQTSWGPVLLRSPGGGERQAGQGLVLGWEPNGSLLLVRWENFPHRRMPEGL
ncbi:MAG: TolB family protein [Bacillota bacterium]